MPARRPIVVAAILALAAPLAPRLAQAQPAQTDKAKAKAAKEYVDAGLAAQTTGDYDTAITLYQKAYDLVPHPVLLFNMAQAHRLAGRNAQALGLYQRYLLQDPKGTQAATAQSFVTELEAKAKDEERLAAEQRAAEEARAAEATRQAEAQRQHDAEAARQAQLAAEQAERDRQAAAAREAALRESPPGRGLRIAGIATASAGVVAAGVGVYFGLRARSISNELSELHAVYDPARIEDGEAAERNSIIAGVAGGVLVAGGAVLYVLGQRAGHAAHDGIAIVPYATDTAVGITLMRLHP